ncbi:MAG TPA: M28 family peptidase, partial [Chloroflexota bacterium]|nr:M28 family peptidase [Chloroflexota bacterium]
MRRLAARRFGLGLLLLVAAALVPIGYAHSFSAGQAQVQAPASVSGARARLHVDALAGQIGSRPAGSAAYDQAVQYAVDQLRQFGYQPSLQTFPVQTYEDNGSQLAILQSGSEVESLAASTLEYAAGGQVEAPLVAAGLGRPDDLSGVDLVGKVALLKRGELRFSDKISNVTAAGAIGAVVYNDSPGAIQGSLTSPSSIPAATVSDVDGQHLLQLLGGGTVPVVVRLRVDAATQQRTATNVIADKPGRDPSAGQVVIGAHLDSVPAGPGANDNGSGSSLVLDLAEVLAGRDEPFGLHFALFGAEELGLFGSRYYVDGLSDAERRATRAMINLDMVGVGQAWRFGGTDDLVQRALGAAADLGERGLPLRGPLAGASDHASFLGAGIPALFIYRVEDPNYHTAGDRP